MRDGWRDVAITVWWWDWIARVRVRPMPEEQPVMSHVSGLWGMVNGVDMPAVLYMRVESGRLCWLDCPSYLNR